MKIRYIFTFLSFFVMSNIPIKSLEMTYDQVVNLGFVSPQLIHVHTLNLSNSHIDDNFVINNVQNNQNLRELINLNLSGNPGITLESIGHILNSQIIGSLIDTPIQNDGREFSVVRINASHTGVQYPPEAAWGIHGVAVFVRHLDNGFNIKQYNPPNFNINYTDGSPQRVGYKLVEVRFQ